MYSLYSLIFDVIYRQGGYVFAVVCLSVSGITLIKLWTNFHEPFWMNGIYNWQQTIMVWW